MYDNKDDKKPEYFAVDNKIDPMQGELTMAKGTMAEFIKPHSAPTVSFLGYDNIEIMRLEPDGDIYVHGRLVENDKDVVDGMRAFLISQGWGE